ncbi:DNA mismatch repair endonuclease MutL [Enterobacteriaceae endosymbiont of Donacia thalassina]|uniref:DNA mismatch repair endonuclease MutL n=1 Tax=Enterobacteriaceae endosymbiont of Donacia thalassina TaxID=2675786 RepID=UPI001449CD12|nr:DNA mismatch repair endonuclease MutL [Enterobacteriaceae endosymbiont of Donacia thalassina]QJC37289.1 DNA mismatch repair endonuclease MutL [Enterobacteriaceae endosymbiont of Donacia thalassina]
MSIKILPKDVIKRIAAGEVIDRPANVIKELIENSIDAKASQINLCIKNGGIKYIYINDNGIGMNKKNLVLCIKKYATSKISNLNDLDTFKSFGFRGEALTSIKAISRMTITSKTLKQQFAWQLYTEGFNEKVIYLKPISHPIGTTIILSDLFYNFPARRLYLANERIEFIYIKNIIKKIILMKFGIGIQFKYNNKIIYNFKKVTDNFSYLNRIKVICGNNFLKNSLEINSTYKKVKLYGWIYLSKKNNLANTLFKYFYVNNRIVCSNFIYRIIKEIIYGQFNNNYNFSFIFFLRIEPNQIDINIHPQKKNISFYNIQKIYNFIFKNITKLLLKNNFVNQNTDLKENNKKNQLNLQILEKHFIKNKLSITNQILFDNVKKKKLVYLNNIPVFNFKNFGKFLTILKNTYIIIEKKNFLYSILIKKMIFLLLKIKFKFYLKDKNIISSVKTNIKIIINEKESFILYKVKVFLKKLGFNFKLNNKNIIHILCVPIFLSFYDIKDFFLNLLKFFFNIKKISLNEIEKWIINYIINIYTLWDPSKIINLLMELELLKLENKNISIKKLFCIINI